MARMSRHRPLSPAHFPLSLPLFLIPLFDRMFGGIALWSSRPDIPPKAFGILPFFSLTRDYPPFFRGSAAFCSFFDNNLHRSPPRLVFWVLCFSLLECFSSDSSHLKPVSILVHFFFPPFEPQLILPRFSISQIDLPENYFYSPP